MAEMADLENEQLVARVYTRALELRSEDGELAAPDLVVYEVEMLSQEVNSGASFEQYFRWASLAEIARVVDRLEALGLAEVAELTRRAIEVAFPAGLPASDEEKGDLAEWSEAQQQRLGELADGFTEFNGRIINALAAFYRRSGGVG
jgi:hypothetical protein